MKKIMIFVPLMVLLIFLIGCVSSSNDINLNNIKDIDSAVKSDPELAKEIVEAYEKTSPKAKDYAENVYVVEGLEECFDSYNLDEKCFVKHAVESNDAQICYEMWHTEQRDYILRTGGAEIMRCVKSFAIETKNKEICEMIKKFDQIGSRMTYYDECIQLSSPQIKSSESSKDYLNIPKNEELVWSADHFEITDFDAELSPYNRPYFVLTLNDGTTHTINTNDIPHQVITFGISENEHPEAEADKCEGYDYAYAYTTKYEDYDFTMHFICCPISLDFCKDVYKSVRKEEGIKYYNLDLN